MVKKNQKHRCARDYALLKKSLEDDPTNMRTSFYLGANMSIYG